MRTIVILHLSRKCTAKILSAMTCRDRKIITKTNFDDVRRYTCCVSPDVINLSLLKSWCRHQIVAKYYHLRRTTFTHGSHLQHIKAKKDPSKGKIHSELA